MCGNSVGLSRAVGLSWKDRIEVACFCCVQATKEAFEAARALTKKLQSKEAALVGTQVIFQVDVVQ